MRHVCGATNDENSGYGRRSSQQAYLKLAARIQHSGNGTDVVP